MSDSLSASSQSTFHSHILLSEGIADHFSQEDKKGHLQLCRGKIFIKRVALKFLFEAEHMLIPVYPFHVSVDDFLEFCSFYFLFY